MDYLDAVRTLVGGQSGNGGTVSLATGVATADSADGKVSVDFGGVTVSPSGGQSVTVPTTAAVKAGDTVQVNLNGADGTGKAPLVYGVVGGGDRVLSEMRDTASGLESKITQNAESVTTAITTANGAKQDAATAASDAASAKDAAESAKSAADGASTAAKSAQATADSALTTANATTTLVRAYSGGVLVCKTGNAVGALVNADGSFQVVKVTWNGSTPTVGSVISNMDSDSVDLAIGQASSAITMCGKKGRIGINSNTGQLYLMGTGGAVLSYDPGTGFATDTGIGIIKGSAGNWIIYGSGDFELWGGQTVHGDLNVTGNLYGAARKPSGWTYMYGDGNDYQNFVRWRTCGMIAELQWRFIQESTNEWVAGKIPDNVRPSKKNSNYYCFPGVALNSDGFPLDGITADAWVGPSDGNVSFQMSQGVDGAYNAGTAHWIIGD